MKKYLTNFLEDKTFINAKQFGFRQGLCASMPYTLSKNINYKLDS